MNKQCKKILLMLAITSFGIPTGIINGFITWMGVKDAVDITFSAISFDMLTAVFGCGLIIPCFGPLTLGGTLKKTPDLQIGLPKNQHFLARMIPQNIILGALVIAIMMTVVFAVIPFGIGMALSLDFAVSIPVWIAFKVVYTCIVAIAAGYLGALNTLYGYAAKGKVSIGA